MRWATRPGVHIGRAACAWLIRRHLDPDAAFVFVDDPAQIPQDATAFDMRGAELGHHGGDCSFETILRRHQLDDPVLWKLAELVHEADLDDERFDAPEARGLDVACGVCRWSATTSGCWSCRGRCSTACTSTTGGRCCWAGSRREHQPRDWRRPARAGRGAGLPGPARRGIWTGGGATRRDPARPGPGPRGVGLVLAAIVAGSAAASLAIGRWGDRLGRARAYALLCAALALGGVVLAAGGPAWLLALVALSGALSTEVVESGPFTTLEQVMLASTGAPQATITRGFGVYNAVATLAGAAGALLGALPADPRLLGGTLLVVGVAGALLATRLPRTVEPPLPEPGAARGSLTSSRGMVTRLAALFALDSLAGGLVVQAWIAYWLGVRYGAPTSVIGVVFAAIGVLQAASFLAAPLIAARVGLLATMVFTHLPSNLLLAAVPLAPACPPRLGCCWHGPCCRRWTCRPARRT
jgi:MFS family permease